MKWISVKDELPKEELGCILIHVSHSTDGKFVIEGYYCEIDNQFYNYDSEHLEDVTHWSDFEPPTK